MSYTFGVEALVGEYCRDREIESQFSLAADLSHMLAFERELARAQAGAGLIPQDDARRIAEAVAAFEPDVDALRTGFRKDGVVLPMLISQVRATLDTHSRDSFHLGSTSQDLIDTSLMIRLKRCVAVCLDRVDELDKQLASMVDEHSTERLLQARTRMQNALPVSIAEKIGNWRSPLRHLKAFAPDYYPLQLGGPEGAVRVMGDQHHNVAKVMAAAMGLDAPEHHWQTDRQPLLVIAFWFSRAASVMGKIAQDVLMMTQSDVGEARLATVGSSSAMPHKANPVMAEVVVAQARYCQTQMNGLNTASIHENERSGTAWTLEWMLLPDLVVMAASSIGNTADMLRDMAFTTANPKQRDDL